MSEDPRSASEFDLGPESEFNQILYSVSATAIFPSIILKLELQSIRTSQE